MAIRFYGSHVPLQTAQLRFRKSYRPSAFYRSLARHSGWKKASKMRLAKSVIHFFFDTDRFSSSKQSSHFNDYSLRLLSIWLRLEESFNMIRFLLRVDGAHYATRRISSPPRVLTSSKLD